MRRIALLLGSALTLSAAQSTDRKDFPGRDWVGTIVDADCKNSNPKDDCFVLGRTRSFGFVQDDRSRYFRLDLESNNKVRRALQGLKDRNGPVKASLHGVADGNVLRIDTVNIR